MMIMTWLLIYNFIRTVFLPEIPVPASQFEVDDSFFYTMPFLVTWLFSPLIQFALQLLYCGKNCLVDSGVYCILNFSVSSSLFLAAPFWTLKNVCYFGSVTKFPIALQNKQSASFGLFLFISIKILQCFQVKLFIQTKKFEKGN